MCLVPVFYQIIIKTVHMLIIKPEQGKRWDLGVPVDNWLVFSGSIHVNLLVHILLPEECNSRDRVGILHQGVTPFRDYGWKKTVGK